VELGEPGQDSGMGIAFRSMDPCTYDALLAYACERSAPRHGTPSFLATDRTLRGWVKQARV
jgi:hypothetical protein